MGDEGTEAFTAENEQRPGEETKPGRTPARSLDDWQTKPEEIAIASADATRIYRILEKQVETSQGIFPLAENAKWQWNEEEIVTGKGRFLGQTVQLEQNAEGQITHVTAAEKEAIPSRMRIAISAGDGAVTATNSEGLEALRQEYTHPAVTVSCEEAFWGIWDGKIKAYMPGTKVEVQDLKTRAIFCAAQSQVPLSLETGGDTTLYYGQLEIGTEEGGYSVVNEVNIETYLMGVVPSEMPGSYGEEAAKVQAVCARSYACSQWLGNEKYLSLGAQVDDSTRSQVYGGAVEYEASTRGVEATWGQVLTCGGGLISTNYFSTSCGYTANGNEVWGGSQAMPYQMGQPQYQEGEYGDLADEENFHAFITNQEIAAYDSHSPWFRWKAEADLETLQKNIDAYLAVPKIVKEVQGEVLTEKEIGSIGALQDVYVYERSQTGMARSLLLMGTERSIVIEGPLKIREILGNLDVTMANGEKSGERVLLPSAFISLEKRIDTEENLVSIQICGGGYGHGVGMSQNGVKGMVDAGKSYTEVLQHFYPGTELTSY